MCVPTRLFSRFCSVVTNLFKAEGKSDEYINKCSITMDVTQNANTPTPVPDCPSPDPVSMWTKEGGEGG